MDHGKTALVRQNHTTKPPLEHSANVESNDNGSRHGFSHGKKKPTKQLSQCLENLISNANNFLKVDKNKKFVKTTAYKKGKRSLECNFRLGIIGRPCSGKSSLIKQIIRDFINANATVQLQPVYISGPQQLTEVPLNDKGIVFLLIIPDIFGKYNFSDDLYDRWSREFDSLDKSVKKRKIAIVFTSITLIYNTCSISLKSSFLFKDLLFLHEQKYRLDKVTKQNIWNINSITGEPKDVSDIDASDIGFLYHIKHKKHELHNFLIDELEILEKHNNKLYVALLVVLLIGEKFNTPPNSKEDSRPFDKLDLKLPPISEVKGLCEILKDTYLHFNDDEVMFMEPCISNTLIKLVFKKPKYQSEILSRCSLSVLFNMVTTEQSEESKPYNTYLPISKLKPLAERLKADICDHDDVSRVLIYKGLQKGSLIGGILQYFNNNQCNAITRRLFPEICIYGDVKGLENVIKYVSSSDCLTDSSGNPPIKLALNSPLDALKKIEVLIKNNFEVTNVDFQGRNIYHLAVDYRDNSVLELLIDSYPNLSYLIDLEDQKKQTPLHAACTKGNIYAIECFAQRYKNINVTDDNYKTPLHLVMDGFDGNIRMVELLIEHGADVNSKDDDGRSPLHATRYCKSGSSDVICLLAEKGGDINLQDKEGLTPLHLAAKSGNDAAVKGLLDNGADVTIVDDEYEMTPLIYACSVNTEDSDKIVQLLLENKSSVNCTNRFGETALHESVESGQINVVRCLLKYGADPNFVSRNDKAQTPLHTVVKAPTIHAFELFKILIDNKADVNKKDNRGNTICNVAKKNKKLRLLSDIDNYLVSHNNKESIEWV